LVEARGFERSLGRLFSQTEDARIAADYQDENMDEDVAAKVLAGAERFLAAVEHFLGQGRDR
jgi:hypothetical protein